LEFSFRFFEKYSPFLIIFFQIEVVSAETVECHAMYYDSFENLSCKMTVVDGKVGILSPVSISLSDLTGAPLPSSSLVLKLFDPMGKDLSIASDNTFTPSVAGTHRICCLHREVEILSMFIRICDADKPYACVLVCSNSHIGGNAVISASILEILEQKYLPVAPENLRVVDPTKHDVVVTSGEHPGTFSFTPLTDGIHTVSLHFGESCLVTEYLEMTAKDSNSRTIVAHHSLLGISVTLVTPNAVVGETTRVILSIRDAVTRAPLTNRKFQFNIAGPVTENGAPESLPVTNTPLHPDVSSSSSSSSRQSSGDSADYCYLFVTPSEGSVLFWTHKHCKKEWKDHEKRNVFLSSHFILGWYFLQIATENGDEIASTYVQGVSIHD
jgi:hypothetical protein